MTQHSPNRREIEIELIYYLWHWCKLLTIDACLGIYQLTGHVFLPEELLLLLLSVAVVLAVLLIVGQTLVELRADEHNDWK